MNIKERVFNKVERCGASCQGFKKNSIFIMIHKKVKNKSQDGRRDKEMKKFICVAVVLVMILGMSTNVFAEISFEKYEDGCPEGWIDLGDGIWISEEMSFEEMANFHATENNISTAEAKAQLKAMQLKEERITAYTENSNSSRVVSVELGVTSTYKPRLQFYVYTSNWSTYWAIEEIYYITMHREYNGISKVFSGDVTIWNRGNNKIEYDVNGDFYNNGQTSGGINVSIGAGEKGSVGFSVSGASNHYKYYHVHNTKVFSGK